MKYIVIVNGKPESGKTTFERYCQDYLDENELAFGYVVSTIAPIKNIYKQLGWDGKKTEESRKHLSMLKQMWIDMCDGPTNYIINYALKLDRDNDHIMFVDIREESEIIKLTEILDAIKVLGIKYTTVLVETKDNDGLEYGNKSDDNIGQNMSLYKWTVNNDGSKEDLRIRAEHFINELLEE